MRDRLGERGSHGSGWESRAEDDEQRTHLLEFLLDPLGVVERRWHFLVGVLVAGLLATVYLVALADLRYEARATVLISSQQLPKDFVRSTVNEDSIANINAMLGKVLSQVRLARIIDEHELYQGMRERAPQIDLIERMRRSIEVERAEHTRSRHETSVIYALKFTYGDPQKAADVANALAGLFTEASIERRSDQARRATEFLQQQLERDEAELREQSRLVSEFRRENRGRLPDELDTNLKKLDLLAQRRGALTTQIAAKENHVAVLSSTPDGLHQSESETLLGELRKQLAQESAAFTDQHPNVVALRDRIARLEAVVAAESGSGRPPTSATQRMIETERRELRLLRSQLASMDEGVLVVNALVDETPAVAERLAALEERAKVLREDYLESLRKVEEAEVAENLELAQQGAQVSILDEAQPPTSPTRPRWKIFVLGNLGSLGLALGLAALLELIDPVVVSARQLEIVTGRPALGSLPRLS